MKMTAKKKRINIDDNHIGIYVRHSIWHKKSTIKIYFNMRYSMRRERKLEDSSCYNQNYDNILKFYANKCQDRSN